jgi:hypothetical protein
MVKFDLRKLLGSIVRLRDGKQGWELIRKGCVHHVIEINGSFWGKLCGKSIEDLKVKSPLISPYGHMFDKLYLRCKDQSVEVHLQSHCRPLFKRIPFFSAGVP